MENLVQKALAAKRESKHIEFKSSFDPTAAQDWCELVKDIVAIADTGGGAIVFGVDNAGRPCGFDPTPVLKVDQAELTDKVFRYTNVQLAEFEMVSAEKSGCPVALLVVPPVEIPLVFTSPGTYALANGKQQSAFSRGTVYFRHGAKSEPACRDDLRAVVDRNLEAVRRSWLEGIQRVVEAPRASSTHVLPPEVLPSAAPTATPIRLVDDPSAPAYFKLTPDVSHPHRQKDVILLVGQQLPSDTRINQFDMRVVRVVHNIDANETFSYRPKFSSQQYSQAFVDWLLAQWRADPEFFSHARQTFSSASDGR